MAPKKASTSSPYFKSTPIRKSTRVSTASTSTPAKKRPQPDSSESEGEGTESEFDGGDNGSEVSEGSEGDVSSIANSDEDEEVEEQKPKGRGNKRVKTHHVSEPASKKKKSKFEEDEEDDSDDESKPPKVTITPLPKLRDEGDVDYEDARIHENTMLFLKDLKKNNNREWMRFNDGEFRRAQKDFGSFIEELTSLVVEKDATIPELPSKDIIFRIYRDVRFSKEKTPYKPHFSAAWSRTGKKGPYAAYYLHLEPNNNSFLGGGLWQPDAPALECLRTEIDQNPQDLKRVLMNKDLKRDYFPLVKGKTEKDVVAAFCEKNKEGALKTRPRGYETTHQDINLLRLKSFTIGHKILDEDLTDEHTIQKIADLIESMVPFITYLNSVVMPDRRRNNNAPPVAAPAPAPAQTATTTTTATADSGGDEDDAEEEEEEGDDDDDE